MSRKLKRKEKREAREREHEEAIALLTERGYKTTSGRHWFLNGEAEVWLTMKADHGKYLRWQGRNNTTVNRQSVPHGIGLDSLKQHLKTD